MAQLNTRRSNPTANSTHRPFSSEQGHTMWQLSRRSAMPQSGTLYVGLDVHKESITVAYVLTNDTVLLANLLPRCSTAPSTMTRLAHAGGTKRSTIARNSAYSD